VKKKKDCRGFLCHSFATIPLTSLILTKIQHRVNSWEFPFYLFFNFFDFLYLRLFLVLLFKRKSLEFTGPCLSLLSMDDDIFF
jgi:hypothetical protein